MAIYKSAFRVALFFMVIFCASFSTVSAHAMEQSYPVQGWSVVPVGLDDKKTPSYCSMKTVYDNNVLLVFARDGSGSNSLAIDFQGNVLQEDQQYAVRLGVASAVERTLKAVAATSQVLIVQLGKDPKFFDALGRKNDLNVAISGGLKMSLNLHGTFNALKDLDSCVYDIAEDVDMMEEAKPKKITENAKAQIKPIDTSVTFAEDKYVSKELQSIRDDNRRLREERQRVLAQLEEKKRMREQEVREAAERERLMAENLKMSAEIAKMNDEIAVSLQPQPVTAAEIAAPPMQEQVEWVTPSPVHSPIPPSKRHYPEEKHSHDAPVVLQAGNRPAVSRAPPKEEMTHPEKAPVAVASSEYVPVAQLQDVTPLPVAKAEPTPVVPMVKIEHGLITLAEVETILSRAQIATVSGVAVDPSAVDGHVSYIWDTGVLFGGLNQSYWPQDITLDEMISQYMQTTEGRCQGDFAFNVTPFGQKQDMQVSAAEIACISDNEDAAATLVFYGYPGKTLTVVSHEAGTSQINQAADARDAVIGTL